MTMKTTITDRDIDSETNRLAVSATGAVMSAMDAAGLTRAQVADALGLPRSRITKVLDGESNITLRTLAQLGLACNLRWQFVGVAADNPAVIITAPEGLCYAEELKASVVFQAYEHIEHGAMIFPGQPMCTLETNLDYEIAA